MRLDQFTQSLKAFKASHDHAKVTMTLAFPSQSAWESWEEDNMTPDMTLLSLRGVLESYVVTLSLPLTF